jgi:iron-sulfur cluster assembly accessory protein
MSITLTDAAVKAVKDAMDSEKLDVAQTYLRVGIKAGGCSGFSYQLAFEGEKREDDRVVEKDGVRLVLDPHSEVYLTGTVLDYTSGLSGQGFVFENPNSKGSCGCGSSFTV